MKPIMSMRFRICLLLLGGLSAAVCMRSHFSMTLICMLRKAPASNTTSSTSSLLIESIDSDGCPVQEIDNTPETDSVETGDIDWPRERTPYLFTVVLLGQVVSLLLSMHLSNRVAPSKMMLVAILSQVAVTAVSPTLAKISYWTFFMSRFAMGVAEGLIFAPASALATRWFPPNERASMSALYTSAFQIAFGIAPFIVSFVCSSGLGWEAAFYIFGVFGLLWSLEWARVGSDDPLSSKRIGEKEREMLSEYQIPHSQRQNKIRPPYGVMFASPVLFAHIAAMVAFYFTLGIFSSFLPTYFEERLKLPIKKNGLFTMIPFLAQLVAKNGLAFTLDACKKRGLIGHTAAAKLAQTIGCVGASLALSVVLAFADCTRPGLALVAMTMCCALHSCMSVGFYVSMLHICPPLTGVIASIVTASGVVASGLSTAMMGVAANSAHKYELLFGLCITFNVFAGVIYLLWGSAEIQPWIAHHSSSSISDGDELRKEEGREEEEEEMEEMNITPLEALT